jgi:hypothetical protein
LAEKSFYKIILDQLCDRIVTQAVNARSKSILPYQFLSNVYATINWPFAVAGPEQYGSIGSPEKRDKPAAFGSLVRPAAGWAGG